MAIPIVVGVGQITERVEDPGYRARSPVELGAEAARAALVDAQAVTDPTPHVNLVAGVRQIETSAPGALARFGRSNNFPRSVMARLGHQPAQAWLAAPGGQSPQTLVSAVAEAIAAGQVGLAVIVGAEALSTQRHLSSRGEPPDWAETISGDLIERGATFDDTLGGALIQAQRFDAAAGYALFDQARRARLGLNRAEYRRAIGELFAPFSKVAAAHRHAALRESFSATELATLSPRNRLVADPYPRLTVARDLVNQGAALVLASIDVARALGSPSERWIYPRAQAETRERSVLERPDLGRSPAALRAVQRALDGAGLDQADLDFLDLYACFAAPVFNLTDGLGLAVDDPRGLTVTGGLPFFGGPGNGYSLHAIATLVERLRESPGSYGLVSANGGYMSKTAVGIYASAPGPFAVTDAAALQAEFDAAPSRVVAENPNGRVEIESFTVEHDRAGLPKRGLIVGALSDGARCLAHTAEDDPATLAWLADEAVEPIGQPGWVQPGPNGGSVFRRSGPR